MDALSGGHSDCPDSLVPQNSNTDIIGPADALVPYDDGAPDDPMLPPVALVPYDDGAPDDPTLPQPFVVYPDLQHEPSKCTGAHVRALLLKQAGSVGLRTWDYDYETPNSTPYYHPKHIHFRVYLVSTDNGGDQKGSDTLIHSETRLKPHVIYWRHWCSVHQLHLAVKKGILRNGNSYSGFSFKREHVGPSLRPAIPEGF